MSSRCSSISLLSAFILIFMAGVAQADDLLAYGPSLDPSSGYGHAAGMPFFDEPEQFMLFSDYPADKEETAIEDPEQNPEDLSTSELLHAYDAVQPDSADGEYAAGYSPEEGVEELPAADNTAVSMLDPLTVVNQEYEEHVKRNVVLFSERMKDRFKVWLSRSGRYMDMMTAVFREQSLPEDLVYLALIESGFNPKAYSWAKAAGPWQFITGTGKKYGLKINWWVDERRDPEKSTRAAAAYLKDLYDMFGTWSLAMAAYNAGEGKVSRAVQRTGTLDYWELRKTRNLARETKEYIPRYLAAKAIAKDPVSYGLEGIEYEDPFSYDVVELDAPIGLDVAARCCGAGMDTIKELNPELRRWCTPPNTPGYRLRVPKGTAELFAANYEKLPGSERSGWSEYVVRRGDTLGTIAGKYNVPVSEIARMNSIRRVSMISVGQRLVIPAPGASPAVYRTSSHEDYDDPGSYSGTYRVRRGDTLSSIARRHGMSLTRLASINGLSARSTIYPGQKLRLSGSARASHASASGTYRVRRGDTLSAIAGRHGMSVDELASVNGISKRSILKPGQRLKVRGEERAENTGTYKVRQGDTLWDISRRLGVSMNSLIRTNSLGSGSVLKPGQELTIPASGGMET